MGKYYLHSGTTQDGPFGIDELKSKHITADTMIWYEGLPEWKRAKEVPELETILKAIPPPLINKTPPAYTPKANSLTAKPDWMGKIIRNGALLIIILIGIFFVISIFTRNIGGSSPFKVVVNPPQPRLVEAHANEDPSSTMLHFHEGVYATILNQGVVEM